MNNIELELTSKLDTIRRQYGEVLDENILLRKEIIELVKLNQNLTNEILDLKLIANMNDTEKAIKKIDNLNFPKLKIAPSKIKNVEYTQKQLAEELGITSAKLSAWKNGFSAYDNIQAPPFIEGSRNLYTKENYQKTKELYLKTQEMIQLLQNKY